mmetsp:Transcript_67770/g.180464  ORF Transcript_67770/g.180464 Transcript_67770/m.180464 type:complete len:203 (-) Transcript_67770:148-756(-)
MWGYRMWSVIASAATFTGTPRSSAACLTHIMSASNTKSSCMFQDSCLATSTMPATDSSKKASEPSKCSSVTISPTQRSTSAGRLYCTATSSMRKACSLEVYDCKKSTQKATNGCTSNLLAASRMCKTDPAPMLTWPQYITCSMASKADGSQSLITISVLPCSKNPPHNIRSSGSDHTQMMLRWAGKHLDDSPLVTVIFTSDH